MVASTQLSNAHFPALGIGCIFFHVRHWSHVSPFLIGSLCYFLCDWLGLAGTNTNFHVSPVQLITKFQCDSYALYYLWLKETFPHLLIDLQLSCKDFRNAFGQLWAKEK